MIIQFQSTSIPCTLPNIYTLQQSRHNYSTHQTSNQITNSRLLSYTSLLSKFLHSFILGWCVSTHKYLAGGKPLNITFSQQLSFVKKGNKHTSRILISLIVQTTQRPIAMLRDSIILFRVSGWVENNFSGKLNSPFSFVRFVKGGKQFSKGKILFSQGWKTFFGQRMENQFSPYSTPSSFLPLIHPPLSFSFSFFL